MCHLIPPKFEIPNGVSISYLLQIFLKQFRSKEIGAVEPTTRYAARMEAQAYAYATAERRRQAEFGEGKGQGKRAYSGKPADGGKGGGKGAYGGQPAYGGKGAYKGKPADEPAVGGKGDGEPADGGKGDGGKGSRVEYFNIGTPAASVAAASAAGSASGEWERVEKGKRWCDSA